MSAVLLWALSGCGLAIVLVRRRSAAIALVGVQSLLLGAVAIAEEVDASSGLIVAALILVARAIALPALLEVVRRRTREQRRLTSDRAVLARFVAAVALALLAVALAPSFGLREAGAEDAAITLVVLGIVIVAVRRAVVFQAIGFLVAENGIYLACLAVAGGFPAIIELGLLFDLMILVSVAAAFGTRIHAEFGTGDSSVMRSLRD